MTPPRTIHDTAHAERMRRRIAAGRPDVIGARELLHRAKLAARDVMRSADPATREDCAAAILARRIADARPVVPNARRREAGSRKNANVSAYRRACVAAELELAPDCYLPDDASTSFGAFKLDAVDWARVHAAKLAHATLEDHAAADSHANSAAAMVPANPPAIPETLDPDAAADAAAAIARRIGVATAAPEIIAHAMPDAPDAARAAALGTSPGGYRSARERARKAIGAAYPEPIALLAAIVGGRPVEGAALLHKDRALGIETTLRYDAGSGRPDAVQPRRADATGRTHLPEIERRPEPCEVTTRKLRGGRRKARPMTERETAESLQRLARAHRANMRKGTR